MRKRNVKVAVINSSLEIPYHSYGDHWVDGWNDPSVGVEVKVFKYEEIYTIPPDFDLYFFVEVRYKPRQIPWYLYPRVLWTWDSHLISEESLTGYAKSFSRVYLATKKEADSLKEKGHLTFKWLPEAYNPRVHTLNLSLERPMGIGYITNPSSKPSRNGMCKNDYIHKLNSSPYDFRHVREVFGERYAEEMHKYLFTLDWPVGTNVGTRMFEASAMGTVVIRSLPEIGKGNGIELNFKEGVHFIGFDDTLEGLLKALDFAMDESNSHTIEEMRRAAYDNVREQTYANRCIQVLEDFGL